MLTITFPKLCEKCDASTYVVFRLLSKTSDIGAALAQWQSTGLVNQGS